MILASSKQRVAPPPIGIEHATVPSALGSEGLEREGLSCRSDQFGVDAVCYPAPDSLLCFHDLVPTRLFDGNATSPLIPSDNRPCLERQGFREAPDGGDRIDSPIARAGHQKTSLRRVSEGERYCARMNDPAVPMSRDFSKRSGNETIAPDFIVIGAQRCGTTWMQRCLIEHPETYVPAWRTGAIKLKGYDLSGYNGEPLVGIFDATILTRSPVPEDIQALAPSVKLIALVRNPVDRAYSWYHQRLRQGDDLYADEPTFAQALEKDPDLVANGIYVPHLRRYMSLVGEERMWVGVFDDLRADPLQFMGRALEFLGASQTTNLPLQWAEAVNYSALVKNRGLHTIARRAKGGTKRLLGVRNQWIVDRLEQSRLVRAFRRANEGSAPALDEATRERLFSRFADDVGELEQLLGSDLSHWKPKSSYF